MLDLTRCDPTLLLMADAVVTELSAISTRLQANDVMLVGAHCRDILQSAMGQQFKLRTTEDIDFGLAVKSWAAYEELTRNLESTGHTGIRYWVAQVPTDLMPFGAVEKPPGTVTPPARHEPMSVWGFAEVFEAAYPLPLPCAETIRIPTVAGYAALKLAAWLDRSENGQYKDAADIATVMYWYSEMPEVDSRLYETEHGQEILLREESDYPVAAAHLLGEDIARTIGPARLSELTTRWPGPREDNLHAAMTITNAPHWPSSPARRNALIRGLTRGLTTT